MLSERLEFSFVRLAFTVVGYCRVWHQPYRDHESHGSQGVFPVTIVNKDGEGAWMDESVTSLFDGVTVRDSNAGDSGGRAAIGCQNATWLSARAALFTPCVCESHTSCHGNL